MKETKILKNKESKKVGIVLLNHIIIGGNGYFSFKANGL